MVFVKDLLVVFLSFTFFSENIDNHDGRENQIINLIQYSYNMNYTKISINVLQIVILRIQCSDTFIILVQLGAAFLINLYGCKVKIVKLFIYSYKFIPVFD